MRPFFDLYRRLSPVALVAIIATALLLVAVGSTVAAASNSSDSEGSLTVCYAGSSGVLKASPDGDCGKGEAPISLVTFGDDGALFLGRCGEGELLVVRDGEFVCGETDHFIVAPTCPDGTNPQPASYYPDDMHIVLGFTVEITGAGSGGDVDSAWECMSGGSLNIEVSDSSTGSDQSHTTTPGHKYVDTVTLRGPLTAGRSRGGGVNENSYEILENGTGKFRVEIEGAPVASANVESVTTEDLVIDEREMTTGADWDYRVFEPGDTHYGSITIRSRVGKNSSELYQWWLDASRGKNIRKNISVIALKRDGSEARRFNYLECYPTKWDSGDYSPSSLVVTETIVAKCDVIELQTADGERRDLLQWITDTVQGKDWKRTVTIKEITKDGSDGKTLNFLECFPTSYKFPSFSASGTGTLYEEVTIKPIRLELS